VLDRDGYPPGVPSWIDTSQPDPDGAVRFYGGLFGWEFEDRMPPDAPGHYFIAAARSRRRRCRLTDGRFATDNGVEHLHRR
jgi:predicted enzyme related to lactoylglutathione lyase